MALSYVENKLVFWAQTARGIKTSPAVKNRRDCRPQSLKEIVIEYKYIHEHLTGTNYLEVVYVVF